MLWLIEFLSISDICDEDFTSKLNVHAMREQNFRSSSRHLSECNCVDDDQMV
jgi:hypothetical protein